MPGRKRTARKKEYHYRRIAALFGEGYDQNEIAKELGISQPTVSNDLKVIDERWKRATLVDFDTARAIELAELLQAREEAWAAWFRSQGKNETVTTETKTVALKTNDEDGSTIELPAVETKVTTKVETLVGSKQFLDVVVATVEKISKIKGLDAPTKRELTGKDGGPVQLESTLLQAIERVYGDGS